MLIKRVRDKIQSYRPQERISFESWEDIKERYSIAKKFFLEDNPIYIILREQLANSETQILENRIREVREIKEITKGFKKIFITPKKLQDDEVVGQIKFIRSLLKEIQSWIDLHNDLEKKESEGRVIIDRGNEKR